MKGHQIPPISDFKERTFISGYARLVVCETDVAKMISKHSDIYIEELGHNYYELHPWIVNFGLAKGIIFKYDSIHKSEFEVGVFEKHAFGWEEIADEIENTFALIALIQHNYSYYDNSFVRGLHFRKSSNKRTCE
jgi:hypothetical protein